MPKKFLELSFSLPPAGLRRNHEANRFAANALRDAYSLTMYSEWLSAPLSQFMRLHGPLSASVTWKQTGNGDVDNCLSALKPMFDNLACAPATKAGVNRYYLGVFDSDSQIKRICITRERVLKRSDEGVLISLSET